MVNKYLFGRRYDLSVNQSVQGSLIISAEQIIINCYHIFIVDGKIFVLVENSFSGIQVSGK